jgi:hypothetical protein
VFFSLSFLLHSLLQSIFCTHLEGLTPLLVGIETHKSGVGVLVLMFSVVFSDKKIKNKKKVASSTTVKTSSSSSSSFLKRERKWEEREARARRRRLFRRRVLFFSPRRAYPSEALA